MLEGTDLTECSEFRYSQDGNYLYSFGWEYLYGWEVDSKRLFIRKLKADFTDNYAMDEGDWRTIEKLYGKKLSSRTYKDFEYNNSSFFNELKETDYGYGLKMPKLRDKDISDFQVNDNIYIIQNYVFSNRRIAELEPTLDKYCHIFPSPNEISIFNQSIPVKSSHEDQFIDFENNKWKLISSNYGIALFYKEGTVIDENDNQILNYSCDSILMIKNRKKYIIPTIPPTTTGNGSNYISDVHILNSESLLFEAGQGPHTLYDIDTNSRTIFQQSFLNEESGGYAHILRSPIYSDIIINNQVFFTISVGGVLSLWDINSGVLLWEFALPYTTAAYSSPYVFNVRRTGAMTLYITLASHETNEQIMNYSFKIPYLTTFINYMRKQRLKFTHRK